MIGTLVTPASAAASRGSSGLAPAEWLVCLLICSAASIALAIGFGRDLNWDFFNYHLYSGAMLAEGRIGRDFLAAGYQGYLNPLPYLPLYWMVAAKWHSIAIAAVLAAAQSLNFFFLYLISRRVVEGQPRARLVAALVTALGACSGVVLSQLGSSFVDFLVAVPVMTAVWLMLLPASPWRVVWVGVLGGLAIGLKLTNVVFLFGLLVAVALQPASGWRNRAQTLALALAGAGLAFVVSYGYWGTQLLHEFGSPVFPVFNQIFRAADFPVESIQYQRFVPGSLVELLALPMRMVDLRSWVYVETMTPDLRPLVLLCVLAGVGTLYLLRRSGAHWSFLRKTISTPSRPTLGIFVVASLVAWVPTSSNGRYATPVLLLLGPLLYLSLRRIASQRHTAMICLALLVLQAVHLHSAGNPRWSPAAWTREWLPSKVPAELKDHPNLFLTIGMSSESYLVSFVHPDSAFVNPIGLMSIPTGGPGWEKLQGMIDKYQGRLQLVFAAPPAGMPAQALPGFLERRNAMVDRLGLKFDPTTCQLLLFNDAEPEGRPWTFDDLTNTPRRLESCAAQRLSHPDSKVAERRALAESIMNRVEDRCPSLFRPLQTQIEGNGNVWVRLYGKYDLFLAVNLTTEEVYIFMQHQNVDTLIGHTSTIAADVARLSCKLPRDGFRGV